jgi:folate-binding protein YgfZ
MPATMLADRAVLRLSGEDVRGFLQGLVTNDVAARESGPVWAGLLTPQGKALFDFILWGDGEDVLIDCEADQSETLARRLAMYRLRRPIAIALDPALRVHWSPNGNHGASDPRLPALGHRWLAPAANPVLGWLEHRLSLGVTEGVGELGSGETLWLECNARELNGVSFTKGCYVGQENTARMHHRAKINRRLVVAPVGDAEPPASRSDRIRATYPELGLMVELRRVEDIGEAILPYWIRPALAEDAV